MPLAAGETFTVALPFTAPPLCIEAAASFAPAGLQRAAWDSLSKTLTLQVGSGGLAAGVEGVFSVPYTAGMLPPTAGLPENSRNLTIKTDAAAGPVLPTTLSSPALPGTGYEPEVSVIQPVGSFTGNLTLSFNPAKAGAATSVTLRFTPAMALGEYESVAVYLPDFSGPELEGVGAVGGATGARFTASWSQLCPARTLTFTLGAGQAVAAGEAVEVRVPATALIRLPPDGIRKNTRFFTISSDAVLGPVSGAVMDSPSPMGALFNVALDFSPKVPGASTAVIFNFEPQMPIAAGKALHPKP
ncbi:hypothetical protein T484DRAFT_1878789 [Baffinella frigidus]|nr:hypothetical protein T484DRAFT_1878789 [Cryptophyta sp. CCMP2293]